MHCKTAQVKALLSSFLLKTFNSLFFAEATAEVFIIKLGLLKKCIFKRAIINRALVFHAGFFAPICVKTWPFEESSLLQCVAELLQEVVRCTLRLL